MEKNTKTELLEILNNERGNLYDFIANNYWLMSKDDLKSLALEIVALLYVYASRLNTDSERANKEMHAELLETIKEYREELLSDE
jgi:hypothetical protein